MEHYLESGEIQKEEVVKLIAERKVFPCYFGSALKIQGVEEFLKGIETFTKKCAYPEEFGARVFKIARDAQGNRLTYLKITGGSLKVKMLLSNEKEAEEGKEELWEEKAEQIRIYSGNSFEAVKEAKAGSVCAVTGLSHTYCGQGLGIEAHTFLPVLEPVLTYKIELPEDCNVHSMLIKLKELEEEEPQLHIVWDERLQEIHAQVMGEVQIEILKRISNKLMGIFFEDISRAADGGLCAEMLQNGDFEYNMEDHRHQWNATTAWVGVEKEGIATENGVSRNNPHYAVLGTTPIYNIGWDGIVIRRGAAVEGKEGKHQPAIYEVSLHARCIDAKKKDLTLALVNQEGLPICQTKIKVQGTDWKEYKAQLIVTDKYEGELASEATTKEGKLGKNIRFAILPKGEQKVAVDLVSLKPQDTYKGHGLRKDLAEAIADLKPRFVRFPGGCMLHGQGLKNIYHWKESVGPQKDRKPAYNIWGYHQTRQLGFYEYFQWCEDMGAEPLPVLAAGVPCQNSVADERGVAGQQGGIPMSEMPQYIQDVLDLVEWANGDPATSKWAKMRADAGHPVPFNLKMIGIGNEDLISTDFEQRYLMICKAVKQKYPQLEVVGTVGPFHFPSSDYIEGWKIARENKRWIDAVDEHYYEQPGWFLNHQDYYDHYDRKAPKVYLGEYASRGANAVDNALAEGIHLCNVERNGDVVEMTSYAPLLCKDGYSNWQPDMIYFDNNNVRASESYKMQKMFGQHAGDLYISSVLSLPDALKKYVGTSVVKDSKSGKTWLKVVNALPRTLKLSVSGLGNMQVTIAGRSAQVFEL